MLPELLRNPKEVAEFFALGRWKGAGHPRLIRKMERKGRRRVERMIMIRYNEVERKRKRKGVPLRVGQLRQYRY